MVDGFFDKIAEYSVLSAAGRAGWEAILVKKAFVKGENFALDY